MYALEEFQSWSEVLTVSLRMFLPMTLEDIILSKAKRRYYYYFKEMKVKKK